jgi:hypothetical protein
VAFLPVHERCTVSVPANPNAPRSCISSTGASSSATLRVSGSASPRLRSPGRSSSPASIATLRPISCTVIPGPSACLNPSAEGATPASADGPTSVSQ